MAIFDNFILYFLVFGAIFSGASLLIYTPKPRGQSYQLACLCEDAPESSLKGQAYHLATPLACVWEDAPESSLRGQVCPLATPLMTPLACTLTQTWHNFYTQHLGKPDLNYWEWRDKPESRNVCQELSWLLELPQPTGAAREVLEALGEGGNPFELPSPSGRFGERDFQVQSQMRVAFKQWHDLARRRVGRASLKKIYRVCYGTTWGTIQQIIRRPFASEPWWQVLGVHPKANPLEVETAYKQLMKIWHPDLSQHPLATKMAARINMAYGEYRSCKGLSSIKGTQPLKSYTNLKVKLPDWLKPFL